MRRILLVFRHEFSATVRRKGFIIFTLIVPFLALLAMGITKIATESAGRRSPSVQRIGYVDQAGGFGQLPAQGALPARDGMTLVTFASTQDATSALLKGDIGEYVVIPPDYLTTLQISRYTTKRELTYPGATSDALKRALTENLLSGRAPPATIRAVEEKENRFMEVLVSRISPRELLFGKVFGLSAAGLLQVAVWLGSMSLVLRLASSAVGGVFSTLRMPSLFYPLAVGYFVLGYLLFAVLSAGVGAVSTSAKEGQQLSALYTIFPVVPLWFMSLFLAFPENTAWTVLSIFPLTAPSMVIERLAITDVPAWQIAAGLSVMAASLVGALFLSAGLFSRHLLSYGGRRR